MLHVAFTLAARGTPQLYYGDELGMSGGDDPDNRQDFPGGWLDDSRSCFTPSGRTASEQRIYAWTRDWIRLRRQYPAVRRGEMIDLAFDDDSYTFARKLGDQVIVVGINRADREKTAAAPATYLGLPDGARFEALLGTRKSFAVSSGQFSVPLPPRTAVAFRLAR
jgi:glycosidase